MMEFLLGAALVAIWFSLENRWWRTTVDYRHPRLLMYHMVSPHRPGAKFNKLRVPPERFEEQIKYLSESGWYFAHVSELAHPLPEKTVVITFDDGYQDNLIMPTKCSQHTARRRRCIWSSSDLIAIGLLPRKRITTQES